MRPIIRDRIFKRDGKYCCNCGSTERLEIDHIIPLSRGGRADEDNLQVLCKSCNCKKGSGIDFNQYFKRGDGENYMYISRDFFMLKIKPKEKIALYTQKFREYCGD